MFSPSVRWRPDTRHFLNSRSIESVQISFGFAAARNSVRLGLLRLQRGTDRSKRIAARTTSRRIRENPEFSIGGKSAGICVGGESAGNFRPAEIHRELFAGFFSSARRFWIVMTSGQVAVFFSRKLAILQSLSAENSRFRSHFQPKLWSDCSSGVPPTPRNSLLRPEPKTARFPRGGGGAALEPNPAKSREFGRDIRSHPSLGFTTPDDSDTSCRMAG